MTNQKVIECLKGQIKCLKCETGIDCEKCRPNWSKEKDIEALENAIEVLENQKTGHWTADVDKWGDVVTTINGYKCSECGMFNTDKDNYCPNCGANMIKGER